MCTARKGPKCTRVVTSCINISNDMLRRKCSEANVADRDIESRACLGIPAHPQVTSIFTLSMIEEERRPPAGGTNVRDGTKRFPLYIKQSVGRCTQNDAQREASSVTPMPLYCTGDRM